MFEDPVVTEEDQSFVDAVVNSKRVYFPVILRFKDDGNNFHPSPVTYDEEEFANDNLWYLNIGKEGRPLEAVSMIPTASELRESGQGVGHINAYPDRDGVCRRFPLIIRYKDGYVPSLSFRMVCDYVQVSASNIEVSFGEHIILHGAKFPYMEEKDIVIPIDEQGRMIINFVGPWSDSFPHYSYKKLLDVREDNALFDQLKEVMDGDLVVIDNVATGYMDIGNCPIETLYPLCGVHTNVANTILTQDFLYELSTWKQLIIDFLLVILIVLVAFRFDNVNFSIIIILFFLAFLVFVSWLFFYQNILTNLIRPYVGLQFSLVTVNLYRYMLEKREKTLIRHRFENYFAPSVLSKILQSREKLEVSDKKVLTILFSDIAGFTAWCAEREPDEIRLTLNEYFEEMAKIVFKHEGTVDKYIGDGMMVFYGDPFEQSDHAMQAVRTAIEMQEKACELKRRWQAQGKLPIQIRIGINTGEVVVGNMGSESRMDYTALGSNVNIAQRLERNAPVEGILISESVYQDVEKSIDTEFFDNITIKGYNKNINAYEVVLANADLV